MNKGSTALVSISLLVFNLIACSNDSHTNDSHTPVNKSQIQTQQNSNQKQASERKKELVQRVVTLTPIATDLIYNLDQNKLVGIPNARETSKKPKFAAYPIVGMHSNINLEKIIGLKPDLVIGSEVMQSEALAKLEELGIDVIAHQVKSLQDLKSLTQKLAARIGVNPKPILDKYQSCSADIPKNGKSVLALTGRIPTSSANKNSWTGDLLDKFNYQNITANFQSNRPFSGYLTLSQEKILTANPDMIFLIESNNLKPDVLKKLPFWSKLKATQNNRVYIFHHDGLIAPTSIDTVIEVCSKLRRLAKL